VFVLSGYDAFLGFLLIAAAVPVLALVTNKVVSPKSRVGERDLTYESGMEPIGGAWIQFNIRYYMFALVFVIFDVEVAFIYPVVAVFRQWVAEGRGLFALVEILIFVLILVAGLVYVWRKGDLQWIKGVVTAPKPGAERIGSEGATRTRVETGGPAHVAH